MLSSTLVLEQTHFNGFSTAEAAVCISVASPAQCWRKTQFTLLYFSNICTYNHRPNAPSSSDFRRPIGPNLWLLLTQITALRTEPSKGWDQTNPQHNLFGSQPTPKLQNSFNQRECNQVIWLSYHMNKWLHLLGQINLSLRHSHDLPDEVADFWVTQLPRSHTGTSLCSGKLIP